MNLTGTVTPTGISISLVIDEADLSAAFDNQPVPDVDLFFQTFSKRYHALPISEKLLAFSKIAGLAEQASSLHLTGSIEPKR